MARATFRQRPPTRGIRAPAPDRFRRPEVLRQPQRPELDVSTIAAHPRVEAGTRIWELYCRLDAGDDEPGSLATWLKERENKPDYAGPWALETLGGAGGQTIVGAATTGTHGGDVDLPPIVDAIQALHLVGTEGSSTGSSVPFQTGRISADADALRTRYGNIQVIRDPEVLRAVAVSAGQMGIIYSVVLRGPAAVRYAPASRLQRDVISCPAPRPHLARLNLSRTLVLHVDSSLSKGDSSCAEAGFRHSLSAC